VRRLGRVLPMVTLVALVAAGCGSSPKPSASSSSTTTSSSSTTTTTSASTSTTSSTGAGATTTTVPTCPGLTASNGQTQGAAGTITGSISLSSTSTCSVTGYPILALFNSSGASLTVTMVDGLSVDLSTPANSPPAATTIGPGQSAEFSYQYSDVPTGSQTTCPSSTTASLTVPGYTNSASPFSITLDPCDNGTIRVSPVYRG
jgi:hypothetical protein